MTRGRKTLAIVAGVPAALMLSVAAGYDYVRGAAFVIQAAGLQGSARTVAEWTTTDLVESVTEVPTRSGSVRGRVYRPASTNGPATLLVPGVHAGGIDEPRLIQFARDVASMGRIVVTAELPDLKRYSITPRSTDTIEDAGVWLSERSGYAPDRRIGMMGISFAGGLSIVAASRPSLRDRVAFVMSFGGHGDLPRTLRYLCTGVQPDGSSRPPHDYGIAIILLGVADRVVPAPQAQPLRDAILAFLHASHVDIDRQDTGAGGVRTSARPCGKAGRTGADADELRQRAGRRAPRTDTAAARDGARRRHGALPGAARRRRRSRSTCCTAPTTTSSRRWNPYCSPTRCARVAPKSSSWRRRSSPTPRSIGPPRRGRSGTSWRSGPSLLDEE